MKVSFQALSRHLDLAGVTAERVAEVLPMLGLEVESVTTFGLAPLPLVVVGEIKSFEKHPKADRLSVCQVDVGDGAIRPPRWRHAPAGCSRRWCWRWQLFGLLLCKPKSRIRCLVKVLIPKKWPAYSRLWICLVRR